MLFREYQPEDLEAIAAVYRDAVVNLGSSAYDPKQVAVWSSFPENLEEFHETLSQGLTIVAVEIIAVEADSSSSERVPRIAAFGQLNPPNHVAFLYTSSQFARQGCATEIYHRLEARAIAQGMTRLHTEASRLAKFVFLKLGFSVVEVEHVLRQGVEFERFRMEKILTSTGHPKQTS